MDIEEKYEMLEDEKAVLMGKITTLLRRLELKEDIIQAQAEEIKILEKDNLNLSKRCSKLVEDLLVK